jgi:Holliday junction resolvasome RuvABC endonuclease subunit
MGLFDDYEAEKTSGKKKKSKVPVKRKKKQRAEVKNIHEGCYANTIKLLALDIATVTGFYDGRVHGIFDVTEEAESRDKLLQHWMFHNFLENYFAANEDVKMIVYEAIPMYGKYPNIKAVEFSGILKFFCATKGLKCKSYPALSVKKFATGYGASEKQEMMEACYKQYDIVPADDNVADAVHLYHMAKSDIEQNG